MLESRLPVTSTLLRAWNVWETRILVAQYLVQARLRHKALAYSCARVAKSSRDSSPWIQSDDSAFCSLTRRTRCGCISMDAVNRPDQCRHSSFSDPIALKPGWQSRDLTHRRALTSIGSTKARWRSKSSWQLRRLLRKHSGRHSWHRKALWSSISSLRRRRSRWQTAWRSCKRCTGRWRWAILRWRWDVLITAIRLSESCWNDRCSGGSTKHGWARADGDGSRSGLYAVGFCLCSEHSLCLIAVAVAFAVLLVGVLDRDVLIHEVLVMHVGDRVVGGLKVGVGYEPVAFGEIGFVAGDLEKCQYADV
jgi:hypothetical protein